MLGTYIRQLVLDRLVHQFLELDIPGKQKQIISLGSGFDTRYFMLKVPIEWLLSQGRLLNNNRMFSNVAYWILDVILKLIFLKPLPRKLLLFIVERNWINISWMPDQVKHYFTKHGLYWDVKNSQGRNGTDQQALLSFGWWFTRLGYHCQASCWKWFQDRVSGTYSISNIKLMQSCSAPTLVISECVLIYLDPLDSNRIIDWLTRELSDAMVALYEQIKPDDAFGRMMIHNLQVQSITFSSHRHSFISLYLESTHWIAWHPCLSRIEGPGATFLTIGMGSCQGIGY